MHIFCLDYTVSVSKSYPLRVQNKLTTSYFYKCVAGASYGSGGAGGSAWNTGANAGGTGWVYVEYGGDIQNE